LCSEMRSQGLGFGLVWVCLGGGLQVLKLLNNLGWF
jgi:hypothetical protein